MDEGLDAAVTLDASEAERVMADLEARSRSFGHALSLAMQGAIVDGKALDDVLRGLGKRMADIALSAGMKPLENLIGQGLSGLMGGVSGTAVSAATSGVTAFAAGGVVSQPTYFPNGSSLGLMGEAGTEAIMPLKRGADGRLGVASDGGGAGAQIVFNVQATDVQSFRKSEAQVSAMLTRAVMRGRRGL